MRTTPEDRERLARLAEKNDALSLYAMLTREDLANLLQDLAEVVRERDHMNEQAAAFAKRAREMDEENKRLRSALARAKEQRDRAIYELWIERGDGWLGEDHEDHKTRDNAELDAILNPKEIA